MKTALVVLWTLALGVGLFLMVRARIVRATQALAREAEPPAAGTRPPGTRDGPAP
ncbi:hypothetical protein OPKNFCMD_5155 [Methylobacterium crusticola]|uniref:CcmD family protein n=1 Tax=Methylobacterium crusticola TaxID=1697972 RepID=A0ABQ4R642_9HYPH|nr:hypothetical protein [Methylobacterium crusticola]GJD52390.1 hypothetical protein OPKNFCMD_5155 [Methylobacterium crusticola]